MRLVLWLVLVACGGCKHVLLSGLNPQARELDARCKAALDVATNWQQVGAACAPVFQRTACRDAWAQLPETPTPEDFSALTQTCARAYCDLSTRHAVTACEEARPLWDSRAMRDLHLFVRSRELGFRETRSLTSLAVALAQRKLGVSPVQTEPPGGLDRDVLLEVMKTAHPKVKHCYETLLNDGRDDWPSLFIEAVVRANIDATGAVTSAEILAATERFDSLEACIVGAHRALVFPPPAGGGTVNYTFPYILIAAPPP